MTKGLLAEKFLTELATHSLKDGEIWRASFTPEYFTALGDVKELMASCGLQVRIDPLGTLYGTLPGTGKGKILFGSHLDTVHNGGKYDGACGIVLPILALQELIEEGFHPEKTVEVVAMYEEEGSRFASSYLSSRIMTGKMTDSDLDETDVNGVTIRDAMLSNGYDPNRLNECICNDTDVFLELHIEQGPQLDASGKSIGAVENIVGLYSYEVTLQGKQNHAGTTPFPLRLDPVPEACKMISELTEFAHSCSDTAVLTSGCIRTEPGLANVIAEQVFFTLDFRDGKAETLLAIDQRIQESLAELESKGFRVTLVKKCTEQPCTLSSKLADAVASAAEKLGLPCVRMNSGAGHDSQILADTIPTGMIFLPSVNGVSHSPDEYTAPEDLANGINICKELILSLAAAQE